MSRAHASWSPLESTDRPITFTFRRSNSGLIFAMYPSSVVHTGVKSFGCENSTTHESPIQSWNRIVPSVVSASKSGAVSPICKLISASLCLKSRLEPYTRAYGRHKETAGSEKGLERERDDEDREDRGGHDDPGKLRGRARADRALRGALPARLATGCHGRFVP